MLSPPSLSLFHCSSSEIHGLLLTILKYTVFGYSHLTKWTKCLFHYLPFSSHFKYCENDFFFFNKIKERLGANNQYWCRWLVPQSCNDGLNISAVWFLSSLRCCSDSSRLILVIQKWASHGWWFSKLLIDNGERWRPLWKDVVDLHEESYIIFRRYLSTAYDGRALRIYPIFYAF